MSNKTFNHVEFDGIRNCHHMLDDHFANVGEMVELSTDHHFVSANKMVGSLLISAEKKAIKNPDGLEDQ